MSLVRPILAFTVIVLVTVARSQSDAQSQSTAANDGAATVAAVDARQRKPNSGAGWRRECQRFIANTKRGTGQRLKRFLKRKNCSTVCQCQTKTAKKALNRFAHKCNAVAKIDVSAAAEKRLNECANPKLNTENASKNRIKNRARKHCTTFANSFQIKGFTAKKLQRRASGDICSKVGAKILHNFVERCQKLVGIDISGAAAKIRQQRQCQPAEQQS